MAAAAAGEFADSFEAAKQVAHLIKWTISINNAKACSQERE
jgi:hypothetical protein